MKLEDMYDENDIIEVAARIVAKNILNGDSYQLDTFKRFNRSHYPGADFDSIGKPGFYGNPLYTPNHSQAKARFLRTRFNHHQISKGETIR